MPSADIQVGDLVIVHTNQRVRPWLFAHLFLVVVSVV